MKSTMKYVFLLFLLSCALTMARRSLAKRFTIKATAQTNRFLAAMKIELDMNRGGYQAARFAVNNENVDTEISLNNLLDPNISETAQRGIQLNYSKCPRKPDWDEGADPTNWRAKLVDTGLNERCYFPFRQMGKIYLNNNGDACAFFGKNQDWLAINLTHKSGLSDTQATQLIDTWNGLRLKKQNKIQEHIKLLSQYAVDYVENTASLLKAEQNTFSAEESIKEVRVKITAKETEIKNLENSRAQSEAVLTNEMSKLTAIQEKSKVVQAQIIANDAMILKKNEQIQLLFGNKAEVAKNADSYKAKSSEYMEKFSKTVEVLTAEIPEETDNFAKAKQNLADGNDKECLTIINAVHPL